MGLETRCKVEWQSQAQTAALHLDSAHLDVRIKPPLRIAFADVRSATVDDERLILELGEGLLVLHLGAAAAARWSQKIKHPRSRLEKLGVGKSGQRVCLIDFDDEDFQRELAAAQVEVTRKLTRYAALVFLHARDSAGLERLTTVREELAPDGAVWVLREKGRATHVSEEQVRERAKQAGLVDVKVLAFSDKLSALKFVVPLAKRVPPPRHRSSSRK